MLSAVIRSIRSYPAVPLAWQLEHHRYVQSGPLVLGSGTLKFPSFAVDRIKTVSRRSKPNSRSALIREQLNPWDLLQPQEAESRHRGAKQCRRFDLLNTISLLSLWYLLSVERWPFHTEPPDHYDQLSFLFGLYALQSSELMPLHYQIDFCPILAHLSAPPLLFWR